MSGVLAEHVGDLRRLVKTGPDPRVRRRAQALLQVAQGEAVLRVAQSFGTAAHRVRAWGDHYEVVAWRGKAPSPSANLLRWLMPAGGGFHRLVDRRVGGDEV